MNMMFENLNKNLLKNNIDLREGLGANLAGSEVEVIAVNSLEEVAMNFKNDDENYCYEYFLVQAKKSLRATPPPFTPPSLRAAKKELTKKEPTVTRYADLEDDLPSLEAVESNRKQIEIPAYEAVEENTSPFSYETASAVSEPIAPRAEAKAEFKAEKSDVPFLAENAELLLNAGETELARNIYRAILKSGDSSDVAYAGLAICADKDGLVEQAIQFAWDSIAFAPNKKGYQILAQLLVQQGRDQEASQALTRAMKSLDLTIQEKADYFKMIGNCQSRLGQNSEAERAFKKALELSPASDEVQSNLGSLYLEQGQITEAKRCYQDAIASNQGNDKAWVGLGLCCVTEGDKESAHEAFARSLEKNLRNSTAIFHLVKCAYEIKKYSTAEKMLSNYVDIAPVSPSLLYSLAGLQFHVGKKREASVTAKRILQMKADHQGARELIKRIDTEAS